jgi:adenosylcobinamide-phosphate guanylyltransferase
MNITALIMAGGKGSRLKVEEEKPLVKICGEPMIKYVIDAVKGSSRISSIVVIVTKHTPKTATFARKQGLRVLYAPGKGFCLDLRYSIEKLKIGTVLALCADTPLITSGFLDNVILHYERCKKPALSVMAPLEIYERIGLSADTVFNVQGRKLVPTGVNIVDGGRLREVKGELEEEILVTEDVEAIVNVNTLEDLKIAESILRARRLSGCSC